ncbi:hypothetical protein K491DRAFT_81520 [Lophiostoma macrostomum CBS 122681]|uniref:Uncharacterized protein n=1 Tax=Lophiostoma macrostomum CBS 122681 TaxID=1314788 RepID=A0A6A6SYV0_9PLEO|nr:hypothetical protein K491DRAFT_81520 [Lophiostoma macrostomum CBS 122681]
MSYTGVRYVHERERSPYSEDDRYYSRPSLLRRNSKRQRVDMYDDEDYDDYPSTLVKPSKPSRALTIRQPSQLEKYNVYNDRHVDSEEDPRSTRYKYTQKRYVSRPSLSDDEREFRFKIKATFGRPKSSREDKPMSWSGEMFRRREKWEDYEWESREKERGDDFWEDDSWMKERITKGRKIKRTRTDEWKPLSGFRRF